MIEAVVKIIRHGMEAGAPSKFAFEASCRHGIRSGLCLDGWRWNEADAAASDVVSRALAITGATLPTWQQGQPEWTQHGVLAVEREACVRCKRPLSGNQAKYCSTMCGQADKQARLRERRHEEMLAYQRARYAAGKLHPMQDPRRCETCGAQFSPRKKTARFCSISCSNKLSTHGWRGSPVDRGRNAP